jgi:hypothetical protein
VKPINITLSAHDQSWLEATFARNRKRFGDLRMDATPPPVSAPAAPAASPPTPVPAPPVEPPKGDDWDASKGAGGKEAVLADLKRARAEAATAARERDALQAKVDEAEQAKMSDLEKANQKAAAADARAEKAERTALVAQVALSKNLPLALASRLAGTTQAELEADADALLALLPSASPLTGEPEKKAPAPDPSQGGGDGSKVSGAERGRQRYYDKHPSKKPA